MQTKDFRGEEKIELPRGFRAAGANAGIKGGGKADMALIASDRPATVAGTFTRNRCPAAPVQLCRRHIADHSGRALVVNSGIANAATGADGRADARKMAADTAAELDLSDDEVFVCSTGSIGPRLPMDKIGAGIGKLAAEASASGGNAAARAIMTTDTRPKCWTVKIEIGGKPVTVAGIAKGAGMIEPDMATMLAFITSDAAVAADDLQLLLAGAVDESFNRITVDGDMSTNDSVLLFANGAAGNASLTREADDWSEFARAVVEVCSRLAWMIVADGEGAGKVATITVGGAASAADAERAARSIANSFLVKTAWAGDNPACGRIVDALGYSGAQIDPDAMDIRYGRLAAIRNGQRGGAGEQELREFVSKSEFDISVDLQQGDYSATVYTCNITEEYVRINM